MKDFLLHTLCPGTFEELVVRICHEILGFGVISFSSGKDGGRDAFFEGTAQRFPGEATPWTGAFVIQAKHTEKADASCSEPDFARIARDEAPKVAALRLAARCDNYLLFTNRKLGALKEHELVRDLRQKTGVPNVAILGKETITSYLDGAPGIAEAIGLQVSPFLAGPPTIPPPTRDFASMKTPRGAQESHRPRQQDPHRRSHAPDDAACLLDSRVPGNDRHDPFLGPDQAATVP